MRALNAGKKEFYVLMVVWLSVSLFGLTGRAATNTGGSQAAKQITSGPAYQMATHHVNRVNISVTNQGTLGINYSNTSVDVFDGSHPTMSCEYPRGSDHNYLYGASLWIGGKVGGNTRVSIGSDGWYYTSGNLLPDELPFGFMQKRTHKDRNSPDYDGARSDEDYVAQYADTLLYNQDFRPMGLKVTQTSMAWRDTLAENFVIVEYWIKNIGNAVIDSAFAGFFVDGDVSWREDFYGYDDDITGFVQNMQVHIYPDNPDAWDTVSFAWLADNNGDPEYYQFNAHSCTDVTGVAVISMPTPTSHLSYNWWYTGTPCGEFGPRYRSDTARGGAAGSGPPNDTFEKYHIMSNGEIDPDPIHFMLVPEWDTTWAELPDTCQYVTFADAKYLLSAGPFRLAPGDSVPFVIAYIGGQNFHPYVRQFTNPPQYPQVYYDGLDFSDIARNALLARYRYRTHYDLDGDGIVNRFDNCPFMANQTQIDIDNNGVGDVCQCDDPRGDANGDGKENPNISDIIYLARYLFLDHSLAIYFPLEADINGDGKMNIIDLTTLVSYLFANGNPPMPCPSILGAAGDTP